MATGTHHRPEGVWDVTSRPWLWLFYLPLFGTPWLSRAPTPAALWWSAAGLAAFLCLYAWGWRGQHRLRAATAILLLAFALSLTGGNWSVIAIYASAMAADLRPARRAVRIVAAMTVAVAVLMAAIGQIWPWGLFGLFMMVMAGLANVSRAALDDKNAALVAAHAEVQRLAATAERERIGRDLHDLLGRTLTLVTLKAELAARLASRDASQAEVEMREVAETARGALAEVRAAVAGMTGAGLAREVEQSRAALAAAGIACEVDGDAAAVNGNAGAVLAMALREAVTNVIRHSGARRCTIQIDANGRNVSIDISDDGQGAVLCEGGGIGGIRARLAAAGGRLRVDGSLAGTRLVASLPQSG